MRDVKVAMIQSKVIYGDAEKNLLAAEALINSFDESYDIALLPECFDFGWAHPSAEKLALPIPNFITNRLCEIAKAKGIHIVAGITELGEDSAPRNTAVLIDDDGKILGKHSKINILTEVEYVYSVGTTISVFDTKFGKIGIPICADFFPLVIADAMARMGCGLILSPCSWAVPQSFIQNKEIYGESWITVYKKIAAAYKIPVIGCSNVGAVTHGEWKGWSCIGNSIVVTADCDVTALPFGEDAECAKVVDVKLYDRPALGTALRGVEW
ncbi:MAG: carbon-nitrogen hydrolase family protein [Firmicutes bacterium]|nr:carbon-nitrogen hydrolase family protein [Bacillota bacterium]